MLSITSLLALFTLLAIASGVFFVAKKIKIPYTVLLVLVGLLLVPIVQIPFLEPVFGFLDDLVLTPELLFYVFLPILIFESAFNMNVRRMVESAWTISLLAIVGLVISTVLIATALYFILPLFGLPLPFIVTLLFGAIISSTDPVAVLALFKEYGAPKRLTLIFEGESLFNDGTAVALFLVVLAVAQNGFNGSETVIEGIGIFAMMVLSGIVLGVLMAILFSRALRYTRSNEFVSITLLIISAHIVFILSELVNEHGIFGLDIRVSSIIATTIAALFLGNYARHTLSPKSDEYIEKSVEHLAFVANSLVFLLAGILFASTQIDLDGLLIPIIVTIVVVAIARIISVYAVLVPLNAIKLETAVPSSWIKLLSWGSLRGALAIIVVLLIPPDFIPTGWAYAFTPQQLLLALTIGCILATLFIKALTIGLMIRKLNINVATPLEKAHEADLGLYYLRTEQSRFDEQKTRGFVRDENYKSLKVHLDLQIERATKEREDLANAHGTKLFEQTLRITAIDIEDHYLKELYNNEEISEAVYRKIKGKLTLQKEKIQDAHHDDIDPSMYTDRKDIFDRLVVFMQTALDRSPKETRLEERLQYYRAQSIISRKVVKTLSDMQKQYGSPIFIPEVFEKVVELYEKYKAQCALKMDDLLATHPEALMSYMNELSEKSLKVSGSKALTYFKERGIATKSLAQIIEDKYSL
ncbi:MAG TPA: sodium:proton antiporter [Candidatus Nitrosotenuis sp.]|nr:sodium:proton antiporter [Candidatus Nitrosotenuis sp.]